MRPGGNTLSSRHHVILCHHQASYNWSGVGVTDWLGSQSDRSVRSVCAAVAGLFNPSIMTRRIAKLAVCVGGVV